MAVEPAHFTLTEQGGYMPTRFAQSHWGDDHLNGPAVVGLAARTLENHCGSPDFMPARLTADSLTRSSELPFGWPTIVQWTAERDYAPHT
jgi:hypothetical protein